MIGVSVDDAATHKKFAAKHKLRFSLLADKDHAIARAFGVATGTGYAERVTFVIDKAGKIAHVFPRVVVRGHAKAVLALVKKL